MPVQATKNESQFTISLQNVMGGLCLIANPESIPDGTLAQFDNWEYGVNLNQPQVCPGVVSQYDNAASIDSLFYDSIHSIWYFSHGTTLYSTNLTTKTTLGTLTGSYAPVYALYDDFVCVASGGQIQKIVGGTTLSIIAGSPNSHYVAHNSGRLESYNILSDIKNYSSIGDCTSSVAWTNNPADISSAQFIEVGYKDASNIACSIKLATDSIVIKTSGSVYRIIDENDFSNISVVSAAQRTAAFNHRSGLSFLNKAYFIGPEGFNSFSTVTDYGDVKVDDPAPGAMINGWYVQNVDNTAKVWHVTPRKQIWCKSKNQNEILIYHYGINAWSKRQFTYPIWDVICVNSEVYIAYGNKIGKLSELVDTDDGVYFKSILVTKRYLPKHKKYLMKYVNLVTFNFFPGNFILNVGGKLFPITFTSTGDIAEHDTDIANTDSDLVVPNDYTEKKKRTRKRTKAIQVMLTVNAGRIALRNLSIDVVEIGR